VSVDLDKLNWNPSSVQAPDAQSVPPGPDPVSTMLSAYLPTVHSGVEAAVNAAKSRDHAMSDHVSSAKSHYQTSDDQGQQGIQRAREQGALADQNFVHTAGSSAGGGGGDSLGSLMGILGQLLQAPQQAAQAVGSVPQTLMQAGQQVAQEVQQMAGQSGKDQAQGAGAGAPGSGAGAGGAAAGAGHTGGEEKRPEDKARPQEHKDEPQSGAKSEPSQASSGKHASGLAPVTPLPEPHSSGRHAADPAVDM